MGNEFVVSGWWFGVLIGLVLLGVFFVVTVIAAIARSAKQRQMERENRLGRIEQAINAVYARVDVLEQKPKKGKR